MVENTPPTLRRTIMRNKFSKFALVATFGLALAFTISCSDDKSDDAPVAACMWHKSGSSAEWCEQVTDSELARDGESVADYKAFCEGFSNTTFYSGSCPEGGIYCKESAWYIYGDMTCDEK
jgi:hypothetical protein